MGVDRRRRGGERVGRIGEHQPVVCSTGGAATQTLTPAAGDRYYLIVPHNGTTEGSYGRTGNGQPRAPAPEACFPQSVAACEP